jgi:hypothetical protein
MVSGRACTRVAWWDLFAITDWHDYNVVLVTGNCSCICNVLFSCI